MRKPLPELKNSWRPYLIMAVLAFTAYLPTLNVGFLWDDHVIIEHNPSLQSWSWQNIKNDFLSDNTQGTGDNYYRPLQAFGHRIEYSFWGARPFGYHLTGLLTHIGCAFLLFMLVGALGFTGMTALMTASLFAVHPIGVEQFLVTSGRTTPLSFFFSLACILFLLRPGRKALALGMGSFVLALLTKEVSVITPVLAALVFYYQGTLRKQRGVLLAMLLLTGVYLVMRRMAVHQVVGPLDLSLLPFFLFKVYPGILWHYVCLLLFPWNLHSHRLIPHLSHAWPLYLVVLAFLTVWGIRTKKKLLVFCLGWAGLGLLPTVPIMMKGSFMLDHWGYPIAPAVLLPLALLMAKGWESRRQHLRFVSISAFFCALIVWALGVHLNVALRGTDEKMYRWALRFTTSNPVKYNLGVLLLDTRRPLEAVDYFEEVQAAYPDDPRNVRALSIAYWESGQRKLAVRILEAFVKTYPAPESLQEQLRGMKIALSRK